jgi:hypothetical protein
MFRRTVGRSRTDRIREVDLNLGRWECKTVRANGTELGIFTALYFPEPRRSTNLTNRGSWRSESQLGTTLISATWTSRSS